MTWLSDNEAEDLETARKHSERPLWEGRAKAVDLIDARHDVRMLLNVIDSLMAQLDAAADFVPRARVAGLLAVCQEASNKTLIARVKSK